MKIVFKAFLITTAFALTLGLTAATASAPAMTDTVDMCSDKTSGTC